MNILVVDDEMLAIENVENALEKHFCSWKRGQKCFSCF